MWAEDPENAAGDMNKDLQGGWPQQAYEVIYGKAGFSEWIPDISKEKLVELLTTGKPTTLCLWDKDEMGDRAGDDYDNQ